MKILVGVNCFPRKFIPIFCGVVLLFIFLPGGVRAESHKQHIDDAKITFEILNKTKQSWNGEPLPKFNDTEIEVTMLRVIIPPGAILNWHRHPSVNAAFILGGELLIKTDRQEELIVTSGDSLVEVVNRWHMGKNIGTKDVEILAVSFASPGQVLTEFKDN